MVLLQIENFVIDIKTDKNKRIILTLLRIFHYVFYGYTQISMIHPITNIADTTLTMICRL